QRVAAGRECEHAGSRRDTGTGAEEAHSEEQSPPFHMHRVSPERAVEEVGAHRPALSQNSLFEASPKSVSGPIKDLRAHTLLLSGICDRAQSVTGTNPAQNCALRGQTAQDRSSPDSQAWSP